MSDRDPTNGELAIMIAGMNTTLERVEQQAIKTNGRISKLELWRAMFIGGFIVTDIFLAIIAGPILVSIISKWLGH